MVLGGILRYCIPIDIMNILGGLIFIFIGLFSLRREKVEDGIKNFSRHY